jgi:phosphoglycolate phosphatase
MIRCAVFDFDGTLVDSNAIKYTSFLDVAAELPDGVKVMAGVIDSVANVTRYEIFDRFVADMRVPGVQRTALSRDLADKYSALCHFEISKAAEIPGAQDALQRLSSSGVHLFVSSATPTKPLRALIRARGWDGMFHGVYGAPESKQAHIRKILVEGGWSPEELVYVGDSDADAIAAAQIGCAFIGVCIEGEQGRFSTCPAQRVATLEMLPELIAGPSASALKTKEEYGGETE